MNRRRKVFERVVNPLLIKYLTDPFGDEVSIAKNIPLEQVVSWLISLSPNGLIEFVPKNDITIQKMIELKGDIFPNYSEKNFENFVSKESKILSKNKVSSSGRIIYEYQR